jgi:hypothetical protein
VVPRLDGAGRRSPVWIAGHAPSAAETTSATKNRHVPSRLVTEATIGPPSRV